MDWVDWPGRTGSIPAVSGAVGTWLPSSLCSVRKVPYPVLIFSGMKIPHLKSNESVIAFYDNLILPNEIPNSSALLVVSPVSLRYGVGKIAIH